MRKVWPNWRFCTKNMIHKVSFKNSRALVRLFHWAYFTWSWWTCFQIFHLLKFDCAGFFSIIIIILIRNHSQRAWSFLFYLFLSNNTESIKLTFNIWRTTNRINCINLNKIVSIIVSLIIVKCLNLNIFIFCCKLLVFLIASTLFSILI